MLAVETEVGRQQALLRCVQLAPTASEVEDEPSQVQCREDVLQVGPEVAVRGDILGGRERLALVASDGRESEHRIVLALDEPDPDRGLARPLPGHARLGIQTLGEIDELREPVMLLRIDGVRLLGLQRPCVGHQVRGSPGHAGIGGHAIPETFGHLVAAPRGARPLIARILGP